MSREGAVPNIPHHAADTQTHILPIGIPCAVIPYYFINSPLLKYLIIYMCVCASINLSSIDLYL